MDFNKTGKILKIAQVLIKIFLAILILYLLAINEFSTNTFKSSFRDRWYVCLDFLEQGVLYGGQPYCIHGPIIYLYLYIFKLLFGIGNIVTISNISNILMNTIIIFLIAKIVKNETNKDYFLIILILYSMVIYPYIIEGNLHMSLVTLLFLFSFYILYHTKLKFKSYISGLLFALSIFTHFTILPYILIVIFFYSFDIRNLDFRLIKIIKDKALMLSGLKQALVLLVPTFVLSNTFVIIFPNIYKYSLLAAATLPDSNVDFFYRIFNIFSEGITLINYPPYFILAFLLIIFIKKRDVYVSTAFLGIIALFLIVTPHIILQVRYLIPSLIFFIITLLVLHHNKKDSHGNVFYKNLFLFTTILILIIPYSIVVYFDFQRNQLRREVEYPLNFIPEQDGYILGEYYSKLDYKRFLSNYYKYNLDKFDVVTTPILPSTSHMSVEKFIGINATLWINENIIKPIDENNFKIVDDINNYKYSLIMYGPPEWQFISSLTTKVNHNITYCLVYVPFLNYFGLNHSQAKFDLILLFRKGEDCEFMENRIWFYYNEHFNSICEKDIDTTNTIKYLMSLNGININKDCTKGGNLVQTYKRIKKLSGQAELYSLTSPHK